MLYFILGRLRFPRRGDGFDSFRCSRKALLSAPWGDPQLIAAVAEQRRLAASACAQKQALALTVEQAILDGGGTSASGRATAAPAAAVPGKDAVKPKIARIPLDIAPQGGKEQAAVEAATPPPAGQDAMKPKLKRIQLDIAPEAGKVHAAVPATGTQPADPVKQKIAQMRLAAFLGGGLW